MGERWCMVASAALLLMGCGDGFSLFGTLPEPSEAPIDAGTSPDQAPDARAPEDEPELGEEPDAGVDMREGAEALPPIDLPASCEAPYAPKEAPPRWLTAQQYRDTLRDLIGLPEAPTAGLPGAPDDATGYVHGSPQTSSARAFAEVAEAVAATREAHITRLVSCQPLDTESEDACVEGVLGEFAPRAWRRPITDEERTRFLDLYRLVSAEGGFGEGVRAIVEGMLQSPNFLYLFAAGDESSD